MLFLFGGYSAGHGPWNDLWAHYLSSGLRRCVSMQVCGFVLVTCWAAMLEPWHNRFPLLGLLGGSVYSHDAPPLPPLPTPGSPLAPGFWRSLQTTGVPPSVRSGMASAAPTDGSPFTEKGQKSRRERVQQFLKFIHTQPHTPLFAGTRANRHACTHVRIRMHIHNCNAFLEEGEPSVAPWQGRLYLFGGVTDTDTAKAKVCGAFWGHRLHIFWQTMASQ